MKISEATFDFDVKSGFALFMALTAFNKYVIICSTNLLLFVKTFFEKIKNIFSLNEIMKKCITIKPNKVMFFSLIMIFELIRN